MIIIDLCRFNHTDFDKILVNLPTDPETRIPIRRLLNECFENWYIEHVHIKIINEANQILLW